MFERFTKEARQVIINTQDETQHLGHSYIGTEHLLLALTNPETGLAAGVLSRADVTHERVKEAVVALVGTGPEELGPADAEALQGIGIDLDAVRRRIEAAFGPGALEPKRKV